jgi:hypothetical protein
MRAREVIKPLDTLRYEPELRPLFCGGADAAWLDTVEARQYKPEPSITPTPIPITPADRISCYLSEALARASAWCLWHADRAERRGMPASADVAQRASFILQRLRRLPKAAWLARAVYRAVLAVAERECASYGFHPHAGDHIREIESSDLRTLAYATVPTLAGISRELRAGCLSATDAVIMAADELAFAPGRPGLEFSA